MIIYNNSEKIRRLHKFIDDDFLGMTLKDKSKELVNQIIDIFPEIRVIEQPHFVISKYNPPNLYEKTIDINKMDINIDTIVLEASTWKFSDVNELANFIKTMEIIFLHKLEIVQIPSSYHTNPHGFITARMVPIGFTDFITKGLKDFKL